MLRRPVAHRPHPTSIKVMSINVLGAIGSTFAGEVKKRAPPVRFARWLSLARLAAAFAAAVAVAAGLLARCGPPPPLPPPPAPPTLPPLPPPTLPPEVFDVVVFSILLVIGVVLVVTGLALRRSKRKARAFGESVLPSSAWRMNRTRRTDSPVYSR
jgi:hypothetical protein